MNARGRGRVRIGQMLRVSIIFAACALAASPAFAGDDSNADLPPNTCSNGVVGSVSCPPAKGDLKQARQAFAHGLKLEDRKRLEEAYVQFDEASRLVPDDRQYLSAREMARAQLVFVHTERGNAFLADGQREEAVAEYRAVLELDPDNQFVQQRLQDSLQNPAVGYDWSSLLLDSREIHLEPNQARATFHYDGDVQGLFTQLAAAYAMEVTFDDSASATEIANKKVRFNVDDVDFFAALQLACLTSKTMWTALGKRQFLIARDNSENHKQLDRMSLATFRVPGATSQQEAVETVTGLRNVCDFQKISPGMVGTVEVRGPQRMLAACSELLQQLTTDRPQVMLDIRVYQINHNLTRNIGVHIPNTFTMFNIPAAALAGLGGLGGQNIGDLINQLISSGGINQAGSSALSGLLAQLQGQGNSIFSQPLATFGGGLTFMGLSLDQFAAQLAVNESWSRSLEHMTLRAGQGKEATFHLGTRFPILNASYAPIFNSPQISQVLGNQSYVPPFPSVSYEDLGLNAKATVAVHANSEVSLKLDLQLRSLTGQSANGVPVISNKEYTGSIRLRDGEPAVIAGEISNSETRSMTGIPGLGQFPLLNQAMVNNSRTDENDELLIMITPHVLVNRDRATPEIWVSEK